MDTPTPSAGPAPVTFTPERFRELLAEAFRIADDPDTLLLATRDHVRALRAANVAIRLKAEEATRIIIALILSSEQSNVTMPAEFIDATAGLTLEIQRKAAAGYVLLRVHTPTPNDGRVQ